MVTGPQHLGTVLTCAGALLLLWAAVPRILASAGTRRLSGLAEGLLALFVLLGPARPAAIALAASFGLFSLLHARGILRSDESCDCFDPEERVPPARALVLTGVVAMAAIGAALLGAPTLRELAGAAPASLAWTPTAALALAVAWRVAFSGPSALNRLTAFTGRLLEGGPQTALNRTVTVLNPLSEELAGLGRRSFLLRVAVFGSALAAAPVRFLLYPGTALGAIVRPADCASGLCTDGYTGFCCEITQGHTNTCPTGTFAGGWWMCTDYTGRQLCSDQGVRYYVDCNELPGQTFPGGCQCGNNDCASRKIACNIFRYGQCNTQIEGTTAVVCRMVVCENPASVSDLHCSAALAVDDATCGHEAPCLEPGALQLVGAGGA